MQTAAEIKTLIKRQYQSSIKDSTIVNVTPEATTAQKLIHYKVKSHVSLKDSNAAQIVSKNWQKR